MSSAAKAMRTVDARDMQAAPCRAGGPIMLGRSYTAITVSLRNGVTGSSTRPGSFQPKLERQAVPGSMGQEIRPKLVVVALPEDRRRQVAGARELRHAVAAAFEFSLQLG